MCTVLNYFFSSPATVLIMTGPMFVLAGELPNRCVVVSRHDNNLYNVHAIDAVQPQRTLSSRMHAGD